MKNWGITFHSQEEDHGKIPVLCKFNAISPSIIQRISKIDNLRTIQIQNFKSIMNETLELRTGTFLSGFNSAGK